MQFNQYVKSNMFIKTWTNDLIQFMLDLANKKANAFWETFLQD